MSATHGLLEVLQKNPELGFNIYFKSINQFQLETSDFKFPAILKKMKETLQYLFEGNKLTTDQAEEIQVKIGKDQFSEAEISSFLTVFLMRPITAGELKGFRNGLLKLAVKV